MALGKLIECTDSEGVKHTIQEYGSVTFAAHTGGSSKGFVPRGVYIDGKRWAEFDDMGMGDPVEQAKQWIEQQIKSRTPPQP